jgi:hypothetical protein
VRQDILLVLEVIVDGSPVEAGVLGDILHGGAVETLLVEEVPGGPQDHGSVSEDLAFSLIFFCIGYLAVVFPLANHSLPV